MKPQDVEKLLGGYATETLTEAERKALLEAALANQELFDALAEEEALRELLSDSRCRRQLLALLGAKPEPVYRRFLAWLGRPAAWGALAGSAAAVVLLAGIVMRVHRPAMEPARTPARPAEVAPAPAVPQRQEGAKPSRSEGKRARPGPKTKARRAAPPLPEPPPPEKKGPSRQPVAIAEAERADMTAEARPAPTQERAAATVAPPPSAPADRLALVQPRPMAQPAPDARALYYEPPRVLAPGEPGAAGFLRSSKPPLERRAASVQTIHATLPPLGLRYAILKNGAEASAGDLRVGDRVALSVEANHAGYVYLLRRDPAGAWMLVCPPAGEQIAVKPRTPLRLPPTGSLPAREQPGEEKLLLVFSRVALPPDPGALAARDVWRRPLVKSERHETYVVDPPSIPGSRLHAEITLTYR